MSVSICSGCGTDQKDEVWLKVPWQICNNYYGITGKFCPDCFRLINHHGKNPMNSEGYMLMLLKLGRTVR